MRVCSGAGCLRAIPDGQRLCDECQAERIAAIDKRKAGALEEGIREHGRPAKTGMSAPDRERYGFLYSGKRWRALRARVVREQPMCCRCRVRLTVIVDHRIPAGVAIQQAADSGLYLDKYAGFYFRSNLQGLCRECHGTKTYEDKDGAGQEWPNAVEIERGKPKKVWSF